MPKQFKSKYMESVNCFWFLIFFFKDTWNIVKEKLKYFYFYITIKSSDSAAIGRIGDLHVIYIIKIY